MRLTSAKETVRGTEYGRTRDGGFRFCSLGFALWTLQNDILSQIFSDLAQRLFYFSLVGKLQF